MQTILILLAVGWAAFVRGLQIPLVKSTTEAQIIDAMRNKQIIMIGDSLMRFQYLSLVYLLRHKRFVALTMDPNPSEEDSWLSSSWYK